MNDEAHRIGVAFAVYKVQQNKIKATLWCAIPLAMFVGFLLGLWCNGR